MEKREIEEIKRHFSVVAEGLEHKIQLVAEGITNVDEKLERFRQEVKEEFKETRSMIKFSYAELDRRVAVIEDEVMSLKNRVERLEARQD
ncbi:MAG: hypothetical protein COZ68_05355 [Deltaproteobacteria bacterium CG_4_8_14_3_um_filter_43_13]|nr:MAG: hypothetical protein COZ68_05355 [Deltaproteobacteria bacterium CG_4_8_14_3_um_filter_43_13]